MTQTLPAYISLSNAVQRYHLSPEALIHAVEKGTIRAIRTDEDTLVAKDDLVVFVSRSFPVDPTLAGRPIRALEAERKYGVDHVNLLHWAESGYIGILERGPKLLVLDEGDVARAAAIFQCAHQEVGSSIRAGWILKRILKSDQLQE